MKSKKSEMGNVDFKFIIINQNVDSIAGGDIVIMGKTYRDLLDGILKQYDEHIYEYHHKEIEKEDPDLLKYIKELRAKNECTKEDLTEFSISVAGIDLECCEIYEGEEDIKLLFSFLDEILSERSEDGKKNPLVKKLKKNYGNVKKMEKILEEINELLWTN